MASEHLSRLVAQGVATGETTAALARKYDYSDRGMRGLIQHPRTQAMIQEEELRLEQAADRYRKELLQLGGPAMEVVREVLADKQHPKRLETARWVVDKILPKDREPLVNVNMLNANDPQLQRELNEAAKLIKEVYELRAQQPSEPPKLLSGEAALPRAALREMPEA